MVTGRSPVAKHWSRRESPSRTLPWAARAISRAAAGSSSTASAVAMTRRCSSILALDTRPKSKRWTRERTVSGTLWGSVVQRMKSTCGGGSSSVLRKAFQASEVSMWASSMM